MQRSADFLLSKWIPAIQQTTTYLGLVVIAVIWSGIYILSNHEHERANSDAVRQGSNLTRVLEEYAGHVARETDGELLALRQVYQKDPDRFDIASWVAGVHPKDDLTLLFGVVAADGFIKLSSLGTPPSTLYVGDREYFEFQREASSDQLYISAPLTGRNRKKLQIEFTRRLSRSDGSFDGIVGSSLDVSQLEKFFSSLEIGHDGFVSLVGYDGIIRARGGPDLAVGRFANESVASSPLLPALREGSAGAFWNYSAETAPLHGVRRLISYRAISGFPLVAVVGLAEQEVFEQANATFQKYAVAGAILTIMVLMVMVLGAFRQAQILATTIELQLSKESSEQSNLLLHTALKNMAHGLCMFNRDRRLVICNKRYGEMYGLTAELTKPGTKLRSILEAAVAGPMPSDEADQLINIRLKTIAEQRTLYAENVQNDGRIYAVSRQPMSDGGWVATHLDVTEQRRVERGLDETKRFLDSIIESIPVGVIVKDAKTRRYVLVNRTFEAGIGLPRSDLLGRTVFEVHKPGDAQLIDDADAECLQGGDSVNYNEIDLDTPFRGVRTLATNRFAMRNSQGNPEYLIAVIEDVTERKKAEQRIAFMAHHDALTGLANRAALVQRIDEAAARRRRRGEPFTVLLLDLDRFKQVNDTLGHLAGDALLIDVAGRLRSLLRDTDVLARLGGDEFAIIQASQVDQREAAMSLAERIIEMIGKPFEVDGGNITIGTSIGIALALEHDAGSDTLLKMADLALYRAKSAGRNGYCFFDPEMSQVASARLEIENDLRRAIRQNELELHYQPIIDTKTRKISSVEALVRWRHPTKGLVFPDLFVPLAEETGLIAQIGEWVLRTACAEAVTWPKEVKVAVNLSLVQFRKTSLPDVIMQTLADTGLRPERLELEITETALIESAAQCLPALRQLKNFGITIVLDDFGTGYSSLSQLVMFPFDKIKIDKSFTQNLTKRADCAAIISATLTLAQSLSIETTAEGVETIEQSRLLRLAGVTSLQGYLFKRPVPASEIDFGGVYGDLLEDAA
jgi:diguanylate cyclase (GGDEF)-like protein/PAS domain S-box-containing protein